MAIEFLKLAVLVTALFIAYWVIKTIGRGIWMMLDDAVMHERQKSDAKQYSIKEHNMTCDGCGSRPWHIEWDPESRTRNSRKFYCPNCTGAT